ncbi:Actin-binding Rho-activating protein-like protein [Aix galericulata]|nr:Actin-binding Rho-activating protein-like protein [Aix galericulata]
MSALEEEEEEEEGVGAGAGTRRLPRAVPGCPRGEPPEGSAPPAAPSRPVPPGRGALTGRRNSRCSCASSSRNRPAGTRRAAAISGRRPPPRPACAAGRAWPARLGTAREGRGGKGREEAGSCPSAPRQGPEEVVVVFVVVCGCARSLPAGAAPLAGRPGAPSPQRPSGRSSPARQPPPCPGAPLRGFLDGIFSAACRHGLRSWCVPTASCGRFSPCSTHAGAGAKTRRHSRCPAQPRGQPRLGAAACGRIHGAGGRCGGGTAGLGLSPRGCFSGSSSAARPRPRPAGLPQGRRGPARGMERGVGEGQGEESGGAVGELRRSWQSWAEGHGEYQRRNPFSSEGGLPGKPALAPRGDPAYGRPPEGSRTEQRGKDAHSHVGREVEELCLVIRSTGRRGDDGRVSVTFGQLFETYVTISNKVVGILLRARKHGLVRFEGEMLWQGKDDDVVITLLE